MKKPNKRLLRLMRHEHLSLVCTDPNQFRNLITVFSSYIHAIDSNYKYLSTFLPRFVDDFGDFINLFLTKDLYVKKLIKLISQLLEKNKIIQYRICVDETWIKEKPKKPITYQDEPLNIRMIASPAFNISIACQVPGCINEFRLSSLTTINMPPEWGDLVASLKTAITVLGR